MFTFAVVVVPVPQPFPVHELVKGAYVPPGHCPVPGPTSGAVDPNWPLTNGETVSKAYQVSTRLDFVGTAQPKVA